MAWSIFRWNDRPRRCILVYSIVTQMSHMVQIWWIWWAFNHFHVISGHKKSTVFCAVFGDTLSWCNFKPRMFTAAGRHLLTYQFVVITITKLVLWKKEAYFFRCSLLFYYCWRRCTFVDPYQIFLARWYIVKWYINDGDAHHCWRTFLMFLVKFLSAPPFGIQSDDAAYIEKQLSSSLGVHSTTPRRLYSFFSISRCTLAIYFAEHGLLRWSSSPSKLRPLKFAIPCFEQWPGMCHHRRMLAAIVRSIGVYLGLL